MCFSFNLSAQNYSTVIMEDWENGAWVNSWRMTNSFDSNGNIIKLTNESWNTTTKVWDKDNITSHTLNTNATINYSITQSWDKDNNKWEDFQKTIYTYDASKKILTQKMQIILITDWMDFSMTTNTYNGSGQLTKSVDQQINFLTMQLANSFQQTITYNADGTVNQSVFQKWNETLNAWENSQRTTNTYDGTKKITSVLIEDFKNNVWINNMKGSNTYNIDGTVKEGLGQDWNVALNKWDDSSKEFYTYNTNATLKQLLIMEWSLTSNAWVNQSRMTYTYGATFVEPDMTISTQFKVFPNPFTDVISIRYNSLEGTNFQLYNANGQLVRAFEKGEPLSEINLSQLRNGIYLLKVNLAESRQVVKLVKQ